MTAFVIFFHRFEFLSCFPIRLNDSFIALVLGGPLLPRFLFVSCCYCFLAFLAISYLAGCLVRRRKNKFEVFPSNATTVRLQCKHMFLPSSTQKCSHTADFDLSLVVLANHFNDFFFTIVVLVVYPIFITNHFVHEQLPVIGIFEHSIRYYVYTALNY